MNYNTLGYRLSPTDEEIITHFLENKMRGNDALVRLIKQVDICKFEPWELPAESTIPDTEEWCFFHKPTHKHATGEQTERTTKGGCWKVTGKDHPIRNNSGNNIGHKKTLVFYNGRGSKGVKTSWVIHEYHSNNASNYQNRLVLCRLKGNLDDKPASCSRGESSRRAASNF